MSRTSPSATAGIWYHHRAQSQFRLGANGPGPAHVYRCLVLASGSSVLMTCTPRPPLHPLSALVCYPTSVSSAPSMLATPHSQLRFCIGGDVNSSDCGETGRQCPPVGGLSRDGYAQGPRGLEPKWLEPKWLEPKWLRIGVAGSIQGMSMAMTYATLT